MFRPTADPPPTCFTTHPHTGCRGRGKVSKPIHCVKSAADSPGYRYRESVSPYTTRASSDTPNAPNHRRPPGEVPNGFCSVAFGAFASSLIINDIATTSVTDRIISNDVTSSADNDSGLIIKITCPSEWSASFGDSEDSTTYKGTGDETIELSKTRYDVLAAAVQKTKGNSDKLKVEIIKDGKVLDSDSTTKEYGVVTVSATL